VYTPPASIVINPAQGDLMSDRDRERLAYLWRRYDQLNARNKLAAGIEIQQLLAKR
jgi:hypothetical protein